MYEISMSYAKFCEKRDGTIGFQIGWVATDGWIVFEKKGIDDLHKTHMESSKLQVSCSSDKLIDTVWGNNAFKTAWL